MSEMRLQKFIAGSGVCSRRKAEELISLGKVSVNGETVTELGVKVNPEKDVVYVNNKKIESPEKLVYILLNKPIGYVTTMKEQFGRPMVTDLLKGINEKVLPVGRLDMYTSGALILTNDGDFIYKVTHPKNEIEKTYNATIRGIIDSDEIEKLKAGVSIDDYVTSPAKARILKIDREKNISRVEVTIHEGKNREVRKMFEAIGRNVIALHRAKIGKIAVNNMKVGTWRYMTEQEIKSF